MEFTGYRVGPLAADSTEGPFPVRVNVGENALGLGPGFFPAITIGGGGTARWTGAVAEITVPWPAVDSPVEVVLRLASGERCASSRPPGALSAAATTGGDGGGLLDWIEIRPLEPGAAGT